VNALDLAIIAVIALSAIFAFARGFVREVLSIIAWVGAAAITLYGFNSVYAMAVRLVTTPLLADLIAGAGLFVISLIVLTIITGYVARFADSGVLSPINRTLGLVFGLARGLVLVSLAYLEAKSERFLAKGADLLRSALPDSLQVKGAGVADDTHRALERAQEAQKAMRAYSSPATPSTAKPAQDPAPSYKPGDRSDMDRLIKSTR
jgi:membrane protein required for colicin V production